MSAGERPWVTACVPAWNAAAFLERTLAALQRQDYPRLRILVSDDASQDETAAIAAARAAADSRVSLRRQPARLGWVGNCNALLAAAEGELAFFAPHDDEPKPGFVSRMVAALQARPGAALAIGDLEWVQSDGRRVELRYDDLDGVSDPAERAWRVAGKPLAESCWSVGFHGVFRLAVARRIGGLRVHPDGEFAADWPWLLALAMRGEIVRVPEALYVKYDRPASLSRRWIGWRQVGRRAGVRWSCVRTLHGGGLGTWAALRGDAQLLAGAAREIWRLEPSARYWALTKWRRGWAALRGGGAKPG